ncbi:MAG: hypothetical protein WCJ85_10375 [Chitinophagaceae bacterium]
MKKSCLLLVWLSGLVWQGHAQQSLAIMDKEESSFERVIKGTSIPCQYEMDFRRKENGRPYFINKDSTRLEFDFFKASSLPFFTSQQTYSETTQAFYDWINLQKQHIKYISIQKLPEDSASDYILLKIMAMQESYYRLIGRNAEIVFSIKIIDPTLSATDQLDKLKLLYSINKKY